MIQRIQSLYLLVICGLFVSLLFVPSLTLVTSDAEVVITGLKVASADSGESLGNPYLIAFVTSVGALVALATLIIYKNRAMQIRTCLLIMLLAIMTWGVDAYYFFRLKQIPVSWELNLSGSTGLIFPVIIIILAWMARRAIKKDEELVRSVDRIR